MSELVVTEVAQSGGGGLAPYNANIAAAWWIDPVNGSDTNNGTTAATPLKTAAKRLNLWGVSPRISQATTVTYLSSQPGFTDPDDYGDVVLQPGGSVTVVGQTLTAGLPSGTVSSVTAPNRARSAAAHPQIFTDNSRANGFWTTYVGKQVRFTNVDLTVGVATILKDAGGGSCWITRPLLANTQGSSPFVAWPGAAFTVTAAQTYQVVDYSAVFFGRVSAQGMPIGTAYDYGTNEYVKLWHVHRKGTTASPSVGIVTAMPYGFVFISECIADDFMTTIGLQEDGIVLQNVSLVAGMAGSGPQTQSVYACGILGTTQVVAGNVSFDGDSVTMASLAVGKIATGFGWHQHYGPTITMGDFSVIAVNDQFDLAGGHQLSGYTTGGVGIDFSQGSQTKIAGDPTTSVTLSGPTGDFTIVAGTKMSTYVPALDAWHSGIATTWAALAADAGGVGLRPELDVSITCSGYSFTPAKLTSLKTWLNPDVGVTVVAGKVTAWADQSTSAKNYTPPIAANQPTYVASQASMNNQIVFQYASASPSRLQDSSVAAAPSTSYSIFVVCQPTTSVLQPVWSNREAAGPAGSTKTFVGLNANNQGAVQQDQALPIVSDTVGFVPNGSPCIIALDANTPLERRTLVMSPDRNVARDLETVTNTWLTGKIDIGYDVESVVGFNGYIAQIVATDPICTPAQRDQVLAYLANKYGISLNP